MIDLPPPMSPEPAEASELVERYREAREAGETHRVNVGASRLQISGVTRLDDKVIDAASERVEEPAQFILLLRALYRASGEPMARISYARNPRTGVVYVHVDEGRLAGIEAPDMVEPYLSDIGKDGNPRRHEIRKVLGEMKLDRAGYSTSASYRVEEDDPTAFHLEVELEPEPDHDRVDLSTSFGNPGNRFLGRYFGSASGKYRTDSGNTFGLGYVYALTGLGEAEGGEDYGSFNTSFQTIQPSGLYGFSASYTSYTVTDRFGFGESEDAENIRAEFSGSQILYAKGNTRWLLDERLQYRYSVTEVVSAPGTPEEAEIPRVGQRTQNERYGVAQLGSTLTTTWRLFNPGTLRLSANYSRGIPGSVDNLVNAQREAGFDLLEGKFRLQYRLPLSLIATLRLEGQLSPSSQVPQAEQWVLGGPEQLSAYLPGVLIGDTGAYGRFQLQPLTWTVLGARITPAIFVEQGTARFEDTEGSLGATRSAAAAGGLIEVEAGDWMKLSLRTAEGFAERNLELRGEPGFGERQRADFFFNLELTL